MMAKLIKSGIVLAVILMFFGGTAMAHGRGGGGGKHYKKWHRKHHHNYHKAHAHHRYHHKRHIRAERRHDRHRGHGRVVHRRPEYRQPRYVESKPHPLAPRIIYIGGLPVPVPPPPHEVLDYLTGH